MGELSYRCPVVSLCTGLLLLLTGRIYFPRKGLGQVIESKGRHYTVIREMRRRGKEEGAGRSLFQVTAVFKTADYEKNRRLSAIPIPFIASQPGFVSKKWGMDQYGGILGLYEWDSKESCSRYEDSFPLRLFKRRVRKESFACQID